MIVWARRLTSLDVWLRWLPVWLPRYLNRLPVIGLHGYSFPGGTAGGHDVGLMSTADAEATVMDQSGDIQGPVLREVRMTSNWGACGDPQAARLRDGVSVASVSRHLSKSQPTAQAAVDAPRCIRLRDHLATPGAQGTRLRQALLGAADADLGAIGAAAEADAIRKFGDRAPNGRHADLAVSCRVSARSLPAARDSRPDHGRPPGMGAGQRPVPAAGHGRPTRPADT